MFYGNDTRKPGKSVLDLIKGQKVIRWVVEQLNLPNAVVVGPRRTYIVDEVPQQPEKR
jgi:hypothetical protein